MADRLNPNESLAVGGSITSQNGLITLTLQGDGNLVLYKAGGQALWASHTWGRSVSQAVMQGDGNFVLYGPTGALWSSDTWHVPGAAGSYLIAQNDANVVIYAPDGRALWATHTWIDINAPISRSESETVGNRKTMSTEAILYRNGLLNVNTFSQSTHPTEGLRGRVLVVCVDAHGRAIWVSQEFACQTCGGTLDFFTPSRRRDNFSQAFPEAVGIHTQSLDIYHSSGPLGDSRAALISAIKTARDIAQEIKDIIDILT